MAYTLPGLGGGGTFAKADLTQNPVATATPVVTPAPAGTTINLNQVPKTTVAPTSPSPIAADTLTSSQTPMQLPPQQQPPDYLGTLAAVPTIDQIVADANKPTATEGTQNSLMTSILDAVKNLGGRGAAQIQAETAAGLPQLNTQLTDVNNQIQTLQKEAAAIPLQIQENFAGRGATAAGVAPIQTGQLRQNAIKSLGLSAIAQTLQGNVALAQSQADKAVELEFAPQEQRLEYLRAALDMNSQLLSREDAKRKTVMEAKLNERSRLLDIQKQERQDVLNVSMEAARNGADPLTLRRLQSVKSVEEAIAIAGPALGAEFRMKQDQQKFERAITTRNLAINEAQLRMSQNRFAFEKEQIAQDKAAGILSETQLKAIDNSPQGKKIKSLGELKLKTIAYQALVKKYGTSSFGAQKATLDASFADLKIAYKTAAELGALQDPDVVLIQEAMRPATFADPLTQIFRKITGSGVNAVNASLAQALSIMDKSGAQNVTELLARNPAYKDSAYVQALATPFLQQEKTVVQIGGQQIPVGSIIQNDAGERGRVEADGTITPL